MLYSGTYKSVIKIVGLLLFISLMGGCGCDRKKVQEEPAEKEPTDLELIKEAGVLKVVVDYNSTNYFVYRGKPMGYQYDLVHELCEALDVNPQITVSNDLVESFDGLQNGRFDIIAQNLTVTRKRRELVDFTAPLKQTRQVLVQRKPNPNDSNTVYLKSTLELAEKKVHVQKNSSYSRRLVNLSEEIGYPIEIVEDSIYGVEQLVARVANGEIDYTVCDEDVARVNKTYYRNIDVSLVISFPQNIAWAVRKNASDDWKAYLDNWITEFKKTRKHAVLYNKYFSSPRSSHRMDSEYHSITGGKISEYDPVVKELAANHGWDWRLVSSIMYEESRFNPEAESWGGAYGLMQLMPNTATALGVTDITEPRENIRGGILMLNWLDEQLLNSIPDSTERIKFTLAAYNIGLGHVKDAQRLARKYGKNQHKWEGNVDFYLRNKSSSKYFEDPVVRWGYARGEEAYNYVQRVTGNYEHYLNVIPK
ncbi:membrane-bound lytic murein transglycosylase F [Tangfeifania diversioriginum]|uniref:Membrane-bound lytic murein transglycosylase F n=1 Tax=Tangfeifania diversioriginum TaxID=1168035 RepID=A0A1M6N2C0_9BACT|nr:transporter substrate-binding domain-containing protein [Tangfeifania diversioriginum]SHJ89808.1 membrane-bound lytic murein transglycosylase F [Tangfeifania diversioriginum]